jgi:secondary thiamine-phosphate synthase enzyme
MKEITVRTGRRTEFVDVTDAVAREVEESGIAEGICQVFVPHTTAGVTINENADPAVVRDMLAILEDLIPQRGDYTHAEGNSDAHVKASLVGSSVTVPVVRGELVLGTWQGIYFCEFDGARSRKLLVHVVGRA